MEHFKNEVGVVEFSSITGDVLSTNKIAETQINSTTNGYNQARSVDSETIWHHEFWIKTKDGTEKSFKLTNVEVPLRVGQTITVISAHGSLGPIVDCLLINHSANDWSFIQDPEIMCKAWLYANPRILRFLMHMVLILLFFLVFGGLVEMIFGRNSVVAGLLLSWGAYIIYSFVIRSNYTSRIKNEFKEHLAKVAESVLKNI